MEEGSLGIAYVDMAERRADGMPRFLKSMVADADALFRPMIMMSSKLFDIGLSYPILFPHALITYFDIYLAPEIAVVFRWSAHMYK